MHPFALVSVALIPLMGGGSTHAYAPQDPRIDFGERYDDRAHLIYDVLAVGGGGYWEGGDSDSVFAIATGFRFRFDAFEAALTCDITIGSPHYLAVDAGLLLGAGVDLLPRLRFVAMGGAGLRNVRFGDPGPWMSELGGTGPHPTVSRVMPALMLRAGLEQRLGPDHEPFRAALGLWAFSNFDLAGRRALSDTETGCFLVGFEDPCETATYSHDIGGGADLGVYFSFSLDFTL